MQLKNRGFVYLLAIFILSSCSGENVPKIEGMVYIPSGEFIMGSEDVDTEGIAKEFGERRTRYYEDERPVRKIFLKGFYMDKYETTNMQYKTFVDAAGYPPPPTWEGGKYAAGQDNHPVNNVTWFDAHGYCTWAGKRLPTEEEWEKAARGPDGNKYPWGNEYDEKKANLNKGATSPVGSYETDKSYYGVYDMGGNVMEWIDAWYKPYPGNKAENKDFGETSRILRGGSGSVLGHYTIGKVYARSSFRHYYLPGGAGDDGGIRCAKSVELK
ncbi:MAG: SUMF1/EgtB/PvdO family nonheme iron enzyme [Deltaproteobacteria bacterium]|nr:SUMF1/EgtB/PvdO family nonheme iron enzyme [Deltaproteobacteria bacterium]